MIRDPRMWPATGDILRKEGVEFTVEHRGQGIVRMSSDEPYQLAMLYFRLWAKDAEVVLQSPEGDEIHARGLAEETEMAEGMRRTNGD